MGKILEAKRRFERKAEEKIVEDVVKKLKEAFELKEQGREEDGDEVVNNIKKWLDETIEKLENQLQDDRDIEVNRSLFPQQGEMVGVGNKVVLSVIRNDEKEKYLTVSYENSSIKGAYKEVKFCEEIWDDFLSENSFVCSIYDKKENEYVGYCSIKRFVKDDWEIAIELMPEYCHKGYGTEALGIFMREVHRLTDKRFFCARVEIDNYASQALMKRLGGKPDGISEFLLHGKEIEIFRKENKELITEDVKKVAAEFCMDAEDILGYVLRYWFDMLSAN